MNKIRIIKLMGVFLLLSGWMIVLATMALLTASTFRSSFLVAGVAVEAVGMMILFRAHRVTHRDPR